MIVSSTLCQSPSFASSASMVSTSLLVAGDGGEKTVQLSGT